MTGDHHPSSIHPPLPPTTEDIGYTHLRLLRSRRVGVATYHKLLTEYGSAQNALAALPEVARAAGVENYEPCPDGVISAEMKAARRIGARLLVFGHDGYPTTLMDDPEAPPVLWALGRLDLLDRPLLSMVGARNASSQGMRMARALARDLGKRGQVIVSGLARGIDAAAHDAALPTGTIAVQAGGIDVLYPAENAGLADRIGTEGLRLSEQPMGLQPQARHFPARNRIIAGLSRATIVLEAAAKSGSLITAREAADRGREVMAVPAHPFDGRAAGCNILLRDGATLVRNAEDVLDALGPISAVTQDQAPALPGLQEAARRFPAPGRPKPSLRETAKLHLKLLSRLAPGPVSEDQIIRDLDAPAEEVARALTDLEIDGKVDRRAGGLIQKRD